MQQPVHSGTLGSVTMLMTPMLISFLAIDRSDLIGHYCGRLVPQGMLLVATAAGVAMGFFPLLFQVVYGGNFAVSGVYFQYLAFGLALSGPLHFNSGVMAAYKLVKLNMLICIVRAVVNLGGDFLLVPRIGPVGAALANTARILNHPLRAGDTIGRLTPSSSCTIAPVRMICEPVECCVQPSAYMIVAARVGLAVEASSLQASRNFSLGEPQVRSTSSGV